MAWWTGRDPKGSCRARFLQLGGRPMEEGEASPGGADSALRDTQFRCSTTARLWEPFLPGHTPAAYTCLPAGPQPWPWVSQPMEPVPGPKDPLVGSSAGGPLTRCQA